MKTIRVKEVYRLHGTSSLTVSEDSSLEYVIAFLGHESRYYGVFLVDSEQRFRGIITRLDLIKWLDFQLFGSLGKHEIRASEFFHIVNAKKAKDLVGADYISFAIKEDDTLQTALEKMLDFKEDIVPVLDSEGHILGDLRLSEVLTRALEIGKQHKTN